MFLIKTLLVLSLTYICISRPERHAGYMNYEELRAPEHPNKFAKLEFAHHLDDGRYAKIKYDVEHVDELVSLDHLPHLENVKCSPSRLLIEYSQPVEDSILAIGSLVVGGAHYACFDSEGELEIIYRRITAITRMSPTEIEYDTVTVNFHDCFKNADVDVAVTAFPVKNIKLPEEMFPQHQSAPRDDLSLRSNSKRFSLYSVVGWVMNQTVNVADTLKAIADAAVVAGQLLSGSYDGQNEFTTGINWNYDSSTATIVEPLLQLDDSGLLNCKECFSSTVPYLGFKLKISDYKLLDFDIHVSLKSNTSGSVVLGSQFLFEIERSWILAELNISPLPLYIGSIPLQVTVTMPVKFGYTAKAEGSAEVGLRFHFYMSSGWRLSYNGTNFNTKKDDFVKEYELTPFNNVQGIVQLGVQLLPAIKVSIFGMLSFTAGPQLTIETSLALNSKCSSANNIYISVALGLNVIGTARVQIKIPTFKPLVDKEWSFDLYTKKIPIYAGCLIIAASPSPDAPPQVEALDDPLALGKIFAGVQDAHWEDQFCREHYNYEYFIFQVYDTSYFNNGSVLAYGYRFIYQYDGTKCIYLDEFIMTISGIEIEIKLFDDDYTISHLECFHRTDPNQELYFLEVNYADSYYNADYNYIEFYLDGCANATLYSAGEDAFEGMDQFVESSGYSTGFSYYDATPIPSPPPSTPTATPTATLPATTPPPPPTLSPTLPPPPTLSPTLPPPTAAVDLKASSVLLKYTIGLLVFCITLVAI